MEMARIVNRSFSGRVRFRGARWFDDFASTDDHMRVRLAQEMGGRTSVPIGTAIAIKPHPETLLATENNVKRVVHLAAISHHPQSGTEFFGEGDDLAFQSMSIREPLLKALGFIERRARRWRTSSVLMPLFNQGGSDADVRVTAHIQINAIFDFFRAHQGSNIRQVHVLARAGFDDAACARAIDNENKMDLGITAEE